jgi:hypothetical protein
MHTTATSCCAEAEELLHRQRRRQEGRPDRADHRRADRQTGGTNTLKIVRVGEHLPTQVN